MAQILLYLSKSGDFSFRRSGESGAQPPEFSNVLVFRLDRSLMYSTKLTIARRQLEANDTTDLTPIYHAIVKIKFPADYHSRLDHGEDDEDVSNGANLPHIILYKSLFVIHLIHRFMYRINTKASTKYDSTQKTHETKLYAIHYNLLNKYPMQRITKEWQVLGFQGNDPATDFRAMGQLALEELLHVSKKKQGRRTWAESGGEYGYSWAICGIQITAFQLQLMRSRKLNHILYQWYFQCLDSCRSTKTTATAGNQTGESSAAEEDYVIAGISGINGVLNDVESVEMMKKLTMVYYEVFMWMFILYHDRWMEFCAKKEAEYHKQLVHEKPFIPVLHHNEFFSGYKEEIENLLFSQQFFPMQSLDLENH